MALDQRINAMRAKIERVIVFIDTAEIMISRRMSRQEYNKIKTACKSANSYLSRRPGWTTYRIQLPSALCFGLIDQIFPNHLVTRFDIALDLLVSDTEVARTLCAEARLLTTQPWHGKREARDFETTQYIASKGSRRNIAIYADRPSKIANCPTVHIELRYCGANMCQRRGVRRAGDLLSLDLAAYLDDIRFSAIDWHKVDRFILANARKEADWRKSQHRRRGHDPSNTTNPHAIAAYVKNLLLASLASSGCVPAWGSPTIPAQEWLELSPYIRNSSVHLPFSSLIKDKECEFIS